MPAPPRAIRNATSRDRNPGEPAPRRLAALLSSLLAASAPLSGCAAAATAPAAVPEAPEKPREPLPRDVVERAALPLSGVAAEAELDEEALWQRLSEARVICFGEKHDSPEHHFAQRRALEELSQRAGAAALRLGVGFEMFQRPYQDVLAGYVRGELSEERLLADSEYEKRWGFDFSLYRPLLEQTRSAGLAALALNAPRELSRKVARGGLRGLEPAERAALPELVLDDAEHRGYFTRAMGDHPMPPGAPALDDMYAAQVLWDETMAETAARWLAAEGPAARLILFAGSGHCHRSAVPARLARRSGEAVLSVLPLLASELQSHEERSLYDLIVVLNDAAAPNG